MTTPLERDEGTIMEIHVTTGDKVDGHDSPIGHATSQVTAGLSRVSHHFTRLDVHLADESAGRSNPADMQCARDAFPAEQSPVAVTDRADTLGAALTGAIHKLQRLLGSKFDRSATRDARARSVAM